VLTVGWVVLAMNSLNLIDNLDGTASGAAAVSALGITVVALSAATGAWPAYLAAAVLGACVAFLPYNLANPARIFLGDGGSTLLGFLLAVGVMGALREASDAITVLAAILLLGVPLLDTATTLTARLRRGVPMLTGGRDHLTHWILAQVGSARGTTAIVALVQAALAGLAIATVEESISTVFVVGAILLLGIAAIVGLRSRTALAARPSGTTLPQTGKAG